MLISIVYDSGYGHTAKLARFVAEGAQRVEGTTVNLVPVAEGDIAWEQLEASDAIIFGSPTYNGTLTAKLKQFFEDATQKSWTSLKWRNKVAAGFTNSGALHGDKLNTLISMALFAAQHGMIWVGLDIILTGNGPTDLNRFGSWLGAMAQSDNAAPDVTPPDADLQTAAHLGQRVAEITRQFTRK